jgi:hypothetical protein
MDEEFALYALETLTAQAPDPVIAESAKGSLQNTHKKFPLECHHFMYSLD